MPNDPERRLSDADIEAFIELLASTADNDREAGGKLVAAFVKALRAQLARQFYDDLGRGIWSALKTLAIAAALALAAWGYKTGSGGH
jgi:hypothetical protein